MGFLEQYNVWLGSDALSSEEKDELRGISGDKKEIESRFFSTLEFGTAGLRGTMGVGLNRMNAHVVRHTTQAFAELILEEPVPGKCVAICCDSRLNSLEFSREAARVIAGNGINVRIFDSLRPTPELSFAIREYGCIAGINITASHNPKEYNGYKVYWADGAQLPPHHAEIVAKKMANLDIFSSIRTIDFDEAVRLGLITIMDSETDELFLKNVLAQANDFEAVKKCADYFKVVFTPFHGAGHYLVPESLRRLGLKHIICVPEQMETDGSFPTVESPNPENPEGFRLAVALAEQHNAGLIIGTDPDADRVGVMVKDSSGQFVPLTGNQTGVLLLDYVIGAKKRAGTMPAKPVTLKTIVTTEMARRIAEINGLNCFDTFTGFKFMAEKMNDLQSRGAGNVIFSFEESYGYMSGDFARDKDAVTASMLIAEMAAWYHGEGMTMYEALLSLYEKYGWYGEKTLNIMMPGLDGLAKMRSMMEGLRDAPPAEIAGATVIVRRDYRTGDETDVRTGVVTAMELSGSNVLRFETSDGTVVIIRPSGTEPKVKIYVMTRGETRSERDERVEKYSKFVLDNYSYFTR
ncbi:MAG: phospho-sugar mutase [Oscillospiraceae bacterium]|nr:phospho-sugar mutase [Oscillospiraceae bacterium]